MSGPFEAWPSVFAEDMLLQAYPKDHGAKQPELIPHSLPHGPCADLSTCPERRWLGAQSRDVYLTMCVCLKGHPRALECAMASQQKQPRQRWINPRHFPASFARSWMSTWPTKKGDSKKLDVCAKGKRQKEHNLWEDRLADARAAVNNLSNLATPKFLRMLMSLFVCGRS